MTTSGIFRVAVIAVCCCVASSLREATTLAKYRQGHGSCKEDQTICVVSANAPFVHKGGIPELMQGCIDANNQTSIVLLAMQDYGGEELPHYIKNFKGIDASHRFKLRHTVALPGAEDGKGRFCHSQFAGGLAAGAAAGGFLGFKAGLLAYVGGPVVGFGVKAITTTVGAIAGGVAAQLASSKLGINCGGVAVAVYSLRKVTVDFRSTDPFVATGEVTGTTATTKKGSVAMRVGINGQQLVVASTHGAEGLRVKDQEVSCPLSEASLPEEHEKFQKGLKSEQQRVADFKTGLQLINTLRKHSEAVQADGHENQAAVIWAGDFNSRSVEMDGPARGCPVWQGNLEKLQRSRDVLGSDEQGNLVTFSKLLENASLKEAADLVCPTYKKAAPEKSKFSCSEKGETYHYKASHPPSWTDRIFYSDESWLRCESLKRVVHKEDHDAVLLTCVVSPGSGCSASSPEEDEEKHSRCCCDSQGGSCEVLHVEELQRSWNPLTWNQAVCPSGLHEWTQHHEEMPEGCIDMLDTGVGQITDQSH
eukprot:TRINITY_DN27614_c0_g1_i1.p1 TRINITY_DN27614_c0_g1~~TRINITY_DN27614_c0_g1_i1.p1  ORF type:complete len:534 (+),score=122.16 TRINITY_DN27614_c0_g1_i1:38-1639(+)